MLEFTVNINYAKHEITFSKKRRGSSRATNKIGAIQNSILKWKFISEFLISTQHIRGHFLLFDGGRTTCNLCMLYYDTYSREDVPESNYRYNCTRCPIQKMTGEPYCQNTPFSKLYGPHTIKRLAVIASQEVRFLKKVLNLEMEKK